jgi:hypothetical protein
MCAETLVQNNISKAMAILIIGGGCLGWIGNKAVDYTFEDVRENTEFRISKEVEDEHIKEQMSELKMLAKEGVVERRVNHDLLILINSKLEGWEPKTAHE